MSTCIALPAGRIDYLSAWELQKSLHSRVVDDTLPNLLLLLEHPHVYTLGRRGSPSDILATPEMLSQRGVQVHHIDRGGEATYHGPGQLVGYPIVNLRAWGGGPLKYIRALEEVIVATLADFGIAGAGAQPQTGVWVQDEKIAAIGVKVSRGVTTHGFALNVNPDLSYFDHIVPCGIDGGRVTSMFSQRPDLSDVEPVIQVLAHHFGLVFGWAMEWASLDDLLQITQPASLAPSHR